MGASSDAPIFYYMENYGDIDVKYFNSTRKIHYA